MRHSDEHRTGANDRRRTAEVAPDPEDELFVEEVLRRVDERCRPVSRECADHLVRSVVAVLTERLPATESFALARHLPGGLALVVHQTGGDPAARQPAPQAPHAPSEPSVEAGPGTTTEAAEISGPA